MFEQLNLKIGNGNVIRRRVRAGLRQYFRCPQQTAHLRASVKAHAHGARAGRAVKSGSVVHVVLAFDRDEPQDDESMKAAADDFLSKFGMTKKLKSGKRRQYADEH